MHSFYTKDGQVTKKQLVRNTADSKNGEVLTKHLKPIIGPLNIDWQVMLIHDVNMNKYYNVYLHFRE